MAFRVAAESPAETAQFLPQSVLSERKVYSRVSRPTVGVEKVDRFGNERERSGDRTLTLLVCRAIRTPGPSEPTVIPYQ